MAKTHLIALVAIVILSFASFGQVFALDNYSHPADCWLENMSGYAGPFTGTNPSTSEIFDAIRSLSAQYKVPIEIIGAVCYQESIGSLCQYGADGFVVHNLPECKSFYNGEAGYHIPGLGLMQLTGDTAKGYDLNRLITDWRYNLEAGVQVLRQKYDYALSLDPLSLQTIEIANWNVLENWRYALAWYNGSESDPTEPYVNPVCSIIASPPSRLSGLFTGVTLTRPQDVITGFIYGNGGYAVKPDGSWLYYDGITYYGAAHTGGGNIKIFNTGLDDNFQPLPPEARDPHYLLISAPTGSANTPFAPFVVNTNGYPFDGAWLADDSFSQWIGPQSNYFGYQQDPVGLYIYRTQFDLTGYNPASAVLTLRVLADNELSDVVLNGTSTGIASPSDLRNWLGPFAISTNFAPGRNTLDFVVKNWPPGGGNPSGLRVDISGTATIWPSTSITIATPTRDPSAGIKPTGNALSGQLNYWDPGQNQWVAMTSVPVAGGSAFDPTKPTIVITHGWHGKLNDPGIMADMPKQFEAINSSVNVLGWDWQQGANPTGLSPILWDIAVMGLQGADTAAGYAALVSGPLLASELKKLNVDPSHTQLVGHSDGAAIIGGAANAIFKSTGVKVERLTSLDAPNLTLSDIPYGPVLVVRYPNTYQFYQKNVKTSVDATKYINPNTAQEIEVYYSLYRSLLGFGTPIAGNNVFNGEVYPTGSLLNQEQFEHFVIPNWYISLGAAATTQNNPSIAGMNWSIVSPNRPVTWPTGNFTEECANTGVFGTTSIAVQNAVKYQQIIQFNFHTGDSWFGTHANPAIDTSGIHMQLCGGSDGYLFKTITIPSNATMMTFDMKVETVFSGDYITLSFGDKVLFYEDITGVDSNFVTTLPIPITDIAGQADTLLFTLHHDTNTPGSSVLLDNITFSSTLAPADLNIDGKVNFTDFALFANHWLDVTCSDPNWCEGTDLDHSGSVDILDLSEFAKYWLSGS